MSELKKSPKVYAAVLAVAVLLGTLFASTQASAETFDGIPLTPPPAVGSTAWALETKYGILDYQQTGASDIACSVVVAGRYFGNTPLVIRLERKVDDNGFQPAAGALGFVNRHAIDPDSVFQGSRIVIGGKDTAKGEWILRHNVPLGDTAMYRITVTPMSQSEGTSVANVGAFASNRTATDATCYPGV